MEEISGSARVWRRALLWCPPVLYAGLIFHFSSEQNPLPALTSLMSDKALHSTEYAVLACLMCRALWGEGVRRWTAVVVAILVASTYAATDEWHQLFVSGRDSDVVDWMADTIGGILGATTYSGLTAFIDSVR